jgi:hypothetical protein
MEISLSLSEFMSITAESPIESHSFSPQQQTLFAMCEVNRRPRLSIAHDISRPEQA